jgi:hypothetical protein
MSSIAPPVARAVGRTCPLVLPACAVQVSLEYLSVRGPTIYALETMGASQQELFRGILLAIVRQPQSNNDSAVK